MHTLKPDKLGLCTQKQANHHTSCNCTESTYVEINVVISPWLRWEYWIIDGFPLSLVHSLCSIANYRQTYHTFYPPLVLYWSPCIPNLRTPADSFRLSDYTGYHYRVVLTWITLSCRPAWMKSSLFSTSRTKFGCKGLGMSWNNYSITCPEIKLIVSHTHSYLDPTPFNNSRHQSVNRISWDISKWMWWWHCSPQAPAIIAMITNVMVTANNDVKMPYHLSGDIGVVFQSEVLTSQCNPTNNKTYVVNREKSKPKNTHPCWAQYW